MNKKAKNDKQNIKLEKETQAGEQQNEKCP